MVSPMDFLSIERSVERIDALTVAVDPEETPYDSKYKARELIVSRPTPASRMDIAPLQSCLGLQ